MSNENSGGSGCSTCGSGSEAQPGKFKISISMGGADSLSGVTISRPNAINFNGDLADVDMLKLENFTLFQGVGLMDGSLASGTISAYDALSGGALTATAAVTTTNVGGLVDSVSIVITPPAPGGVATTHLFERITDGAYVGIRYTRTEGSESDSMEFYNNGIGVPSGDPLLGQFRQLNLDGSLESWDAPPATFVWNTDTGHVNGGYYTGSQVDSHEYIPADTNQPKVTTTRTYSKIGDEDTSQLVLINEEVSRVLGTTTLSTEVTRYGYDESVWLEPTTGYPYGRENDNFGKQVWRADPDDQWTLSMPQEVPALVQAYYYDAELDWWLPEWDENWDPVMTIDFVYADPLVFTPWLDGPALPGNFDTQAGAEAFFAGLMAEAKANDFEIAGCRRVQTTAGSTLDVTVAWNELRHASIAGVMQGVEYSYDSAYSGLDTGGTLGSVVLANREERWNAGETVASWSASSTGDANFSVSLDHTGVARLSTTSLLEAGGTVNDSWQVVATAAGGGTYDEYRNPPSYTAGVDHPLWSTTTRDDQGRTVAETAKFSAAGTEIQTVTTAYTGETAYTRTAGGVTLASQGEDVVASGQRTSVSTDAQGVVTTTVTDDATGEMISESRVGTDAGLDVTTNYAKSTNTTTGEITLTVTQTDGTTTRTLSITITDAQGRTVSATDANGGVTSYAYTNQGRTVTTTLPGGGTQITDTYLDGQIKSITGTAVTAEFHHYTVNDDSDPNYEAGSITETVYLGTDSGSAWRKTTTNYLGQVLREEAPSPTGTGVSVTTHSYNAKGQRVKTSRSGMADLIIAYDVWGRVSQQGYDMNADVALTVSSTDVLSTSATDYVEAEGTVLERVVRAKYTEDGTDTVLQTKTERKLLQGSSWQRTTQADGGVWTQQGAMSGSTRTVTTQQSVTGTQLQSQTYQNGFLMSETPPGTTQAVTYAYTGFGELYQVVHPLNGTTTRTYDEDTGQLLTQSQSGTGLTGSAETYSYVTTGNGLGQVAMVTHADTSTTTYTYDVQGRVLTQSGTAGYPLRYDYDTLGRLWKLHTYRDATPNLTLDGDVTTWAYDTGSGVLLSKTDAGSHSVSYTYDAAGRQLTRTNARSIVTTYGYDDVGRLTSVDYGDSTPDVTSIGYDRAGRRTSTTDAAGEHAFTYDAASGGQLDTWTVSGSGAWSGLAVDLDYSGGRRSGRATGLGSISLPSVGYTWTSASGRLDTVAADGITATYGYNAGTGWNEGVTYSGGSALSSTRSPDTLGRLDTISWSVGAATVSGHDYTVNAMNRRTDALRQDGSAWSYGYNTRGEVTSAEKVDAAMAAEPGKQFAFEYDGLGNRTSSSVSSVANAAVLRSTGYTPNALNQYDTLTHPQPGWLVLRGSTNATAGATVTVDGEATTTSGALWFYEKSVDNSAGPVQRTTTISATRPDGGVNGGPVTTQRTGSVFIPPPSESPTYDLDGNLTGDARWNYTWDGENRLIVAEEKTGVTLLPSGGVVKRYRLEFSYDSQGRRVSKSVLVATGSGGFVLQQSLVMLYDGWNMIAEIDTTTSATLLRSYVWGMDVSGTVTGAGGVGGLLIERFHAVASIQQLASSHAPCYDGNGNVTELVNLADGSVSARYEYGAFGETISVDGGAVAQANPFRFSTKYLDGETGMYYYGYRYFDPANGRWLSRDPIGERGGMNLYGMCGNDPVNKWDYLGMADYQIIFSLITFTPEGARDYEAYQHTLDPADFTSAAEREKMERDLYKELQKSIEDAEKILKMTGVLDSNDSLTIKSSTTTDQISKLCQKADYSFLIAHGRTRGKEGYVVNPLLPGYPNDSRPTGKELLKQLKGKLVSVCGCNPKKGEQGMGSVIRQIITEIRKLEKK